MVLNRQPLTEAVAMLVLEWRKECRESLRTAREIRPDRQRRWWEGLPDSPHLYFEYNVGYPVAVGGLTFIDRDTGCAEISLIVKPSHYRKGVGSAVVADLVEEARQMRLLAVIGECYDCSPAGGFWRKIVEEYRGHETRLPAPRKWWDGQAWGSLYFVLPLSSDDQVRSSPSISSATPK